MLANALERAFRPQTQLGRAVPAGSSAWAGTSMNPRAPTGALAPKARFAPVGFQFSIAPDPVYPWPRDQVALIRRSYDSGFVPLHRKLIYRDTQTNGIWTFHHHGVGRWDPDAEPEHEIVNATRIQSGFGSDFRANIVERWFQNVDHVRPGTVRFANNLPAPYIPWGAWVLTWVMETCWQADSEAKKRYVKEKDREERDATEKRQADLNAEAAYVDRGEANYRKDLADKLSEQDWKELVARQTGGFDDRPRKAYGLPK